jgi:nucleoside-diphosphate-sugar epimerase
MTPDLLQQTSKIVIPGGAGLVGQNLVARLEELGCSEILVIDKSAANIKVLQALHPQIRSVCADLSEPGEWELLFCDAQAVVMLQAQIGARNREPFIRNTIEATRNVLAAMSKAHVPYLVHVSSSVVNSAADDLYTTAKREQERLVHESDIPHVVLRPTLMFGWFDRKHLGWLSRFMRRTPVFPIPGHGRYLRQPLYVGDFCEIIISCLKSRPVDRSFDITGLQRIHYIDLIYQIRRAIGAKCAIVRIPYKLFRLLLRVWALFDPNPPFTTEQLAALTAGDVFDVIDWEVIFGVPATPLDAALERTFRDPRYRDIVLEF